MTSDELREEVGIELDAMTEIVAEAIRLYKDIGDNTPNLREKTAAGAFLAHFYNGVENILKRICYFYNKPLPEGANWHISLFKRFCKPSENPLPVIFDERLAEKISPFRSFRHIFFHCYGFQLDWEVMKEGIRELENILSDFKSAVSSFLQFL